MPNPTSAELVESRLRDRLAPVSLLSVFFVFSVAVVGPKTEPVWNAVIVAAAALLIVVGWLLIGNVVTVDTSTVVAAAATFAVLFLVADVVIVAGTLGGNVLLWGAYAGLGGILASLVLRPNRAPRRLPRARAAAVAVLVLAIGAWVIVVAEAPLDDVYELHLAGAEALAEGLNPYVHVMVPDRAPVAEPGSVIAYPYPPLVALLLSLSMWLFGDPRWLLVASLAIAAWLVVAAAGFDRRLGAAAGTALGVAFAAQIGLTRIVRFAWTEPLSLAFLLPGAIVWSRWPVGSGILLGLGFATKQYFVAAIPLLLLATDEGRWQRFASATLTATLAILPAFIWSPRAAWDALVEFHITRPHRLDALNLAGMEIEIPAVVAVIATILVGVAFGRHVRDGATFLLGLAATLATLFALGSQAFENYWFLVGALTLGYLALWRTSVDRVENPRDLAAPRTAGTRPGVGRLDRDADAQH